MRHSASIALLVPVLTAASLAAQTPPSSDHPDHIRGTVINRIDHEPIPRALVYSPDNHFATLTDDRGHFDFALPTSAPDAANSTPSLGGAFIAAAGPPPGGYPNALVARKPGFLARRQGQDMVPVDPTRPEVTLYLVPEARIIGRIVVPGSASFQVYDGADTVQVTLFRRQVREEREHWDPAGEVVVRSDGEFRFFDLPAGDYKLQTNELLDRDPLTFVTNGQQFGFPPVFFPSSSDFASATTLHLAAGESLQATISLNRREYYPVRIPVTNVPPGIRPEILVWPAAQPGPGFSLGYDPRQASVRGLLPDGTYTVSVVTRSPSAFTGTTTLTVHGAAASGPAITLVPAPSISVVIHEDFTTRSDAANNSLLSSGPIFTGFARDRGYNGYLMPDEPFGLGNPVSLGSSSSPEHTSYTFDGVSPGRYRIKIAGNGEYVAAITAGGTDLLKEPLVVGIGSAPPQIEITMRNDGAIINGELIDSAENSVRDATPRGSTFIPRPVYFLPIAGEGTFATAWAQPDGKFQLHNLAPGNYDVLAFDTPQMDIEQQGGLDLHQYESQSIQITVTANQTQSLRLPVISVPE